MQALQAGWYAPTVDTPTQAIRPINATAFQTIRKGRFIVEVAIIENGIPIPVFDHAPAWLQAAGRAANRHIYTLAKTQLEAYLDHINDA